MTKEQIIDAVRQLPDDFQLEDVFERLLFIERLEHRITQSDRNEVVSFEEAKKRFSKQHSDAA